MISKSGNNSMIILMHFMNKHLLYAKLYKIVQVYQLDIVRKLFLSNPYAEYLSSESWTAGKVVGL